MYCIRFLMNNRFIYIALVGRLTSRFDDIVMEIKNAARDYHCITKEIKVSNFFSEDEDSIKEKIDKGNDNKKQISNYITHNISKNKKANNNEKVIFIISHLKRPSEIKELKEQYGDDFYALGIHTSHRAAIRRMRRYSFEKIVGKRYKSTRDKSNEFRKNLDEPALKESYINSLITRDEGEKNEEGQKLLKTLPLCDFFINDFRGDDFVTPIRRFLGLILKKNLFEPPTMEEVAMNWAYSAAARSVDQSRQVGAVIVHKEGYFLVDGTNNVPKFGGGTYDATQGNDTNYQRKQDLFHQIKEKCSLNEKQAEALKETALRDLLEFSHNVHAEQNAICSAARKAINIQGSKIYTTTFPCHLCSKIIIDAGIEEVIYIEPYGKSRAFDLNPNEVSIDLFVKEKVLFRLFVGVHPKRFQNFFLHDEKREKDGNRLFSEDENKK